MGSVNKFIGNLSLRGKFLLVGLAVLVPLSVLCFSVIRLEVEKAGVARHESRGLLWETQLVAIAANLSEYREHCVAVAAGATDERDEMQEHASRVRDAAAALDALAAEGDTEFTDASKWTALRPRVAAALEGTGADAARQAELQALVADLHDSVQVVSEDSELILDPGADTFPLMFASLFDLPRGVEALASARRAMDHIVASDESLGQHVALAAEAANARTRLRSGMRFLGVSYPAAATIPSKIPEQAQGIAKRLDAVFELLEGEGRGGIDKARARQMSHDMEVLTEDLTALRESTMVELSSLLHARVRASQWAMAIEALLVALCVLLAWRVQSRVTGYIADRLDSANAAFGRLAQGKFDNEFGEHTGDELGALLAALANMQGELSARVQKDLKAANDERERAVASERIRQALDASSVNVVVCDDQYHVIHVNPAAQRLMSAAQADFRQAQPRFDAGRLVGASVDMLFAEPARQREAMAQARQAISTQLAVGSRVLVCTASPITSPDGKRLGTVIEWLDRTQEVAAKKEIGSLVTAVVEGKLERRIEVAGKSGFFEVLATGLNGLVSSVSDAVAELRGLVESANEGDLTRSMQLDGRSGLYVSIGTGVNSLIATMEGLVSEVKGMTFQVHAGAEEISRGNLNLSQRTEEQAASLEETAASMEEMTTTVRQTAENAGQANQLAMAARQQAESGGAVVGSAVTAMSAINDASRKIADIIGVIDEIAFQTNLLALNAAVEAARAGEQGRGFAVVATEVRNLAGRSATAAKEIKLLIQDSVGKVEEGSRLVDESGRTLVQIVGAVKKVTDIVAEIAAASREQSAGIEQVNKAVVQMDGGTQQNAALVEQAAAASQAIVEQAQLLNALVANYKVGKGATERRERAAARRRPATITENGIPAVRAGSR